MYISPNGIENETKVAIASNLPVQDEGTVAAIEKLIAELIRFGMQVRISKPDVAGTRCLVFTINDETYKVDMLESRKSKNYLLETALERACVVYKVSKEEFGLILRSLPPTPAQIKDKQAPGVRKLRDLQFSKDTQKAQLQAEQVRRESSESTSLLERLSRSFTSSSSISESIKSGKSSEDIYNLSRSEVRPRMLALGGKRSSSSRSLGSS